MPVLSCHLIYTCRPFLVVQSPTPTLKRRADTSWTRGPDTAFISSPFSSCVVPPSLGTGNPNTGLENFRSRICIDSSDRLSPLARDGLVQSCGSTQPCVEQATYPTEKDSLSSRFFVNQSSELVLEFAGDVGRRGSLSVLSFWSKRKHGNELPKNQMI